jgi:hypothetical protein
LENFQPQAWTFALFGTAICSNGFHLPDTSDGEQQPPVKHLKTEWAEKSKKKIEKTSQRELRGQKRACVVCGSDPEKLGFQT